MKTAFGNTKKIEKKLYQNMGQNAMIKQCWDSSNTRLDQESPQRMFDTVN
jgi:hypothetical protein